MGDMGGGAGEEDLDRGGLLVDNVRAGMSANCEKLEDARDAVLERTRRGYQSQSLDVAWATSVAQYRRNSRRCSSMQGSSPGR